MPKRTKDQRRKDRKDRKATKRRVVYHPDGSKTIPLSPEALRAFEMQIEEFKRRFGREPRPNDPLFFDPDLPASMGPVPLQRVKLDLLREQMVESMRARGVDPAFLYTFEKMDGLLVTEENHHLISPEDRAEWDRHVGGYRRAHPNETPADAPAYLPAMEEEWTPDDVDHLITNPIYAGAGPYPAIVGEDLWIACAARFIQEEGVPAFMANFVGHLSDLFGSRPPPPDLILKTKEIAAGIEPVALARFALDLTRKLFKDEDAESVE